MDEQKNDDQSSRLGDEDLAISDRAKNSSFEQLLGPGTEADEAEIDRVVEAARNEYYLSKRPKG